MPDSPNIYELAGREKKAGALLDALYSQGWQDITHAMEPRHWAAVAQVAGVKPPSPDTIALVKQRLAARKGGQ
jgi:hypothetical protein